MAHDSHITCWTLIDGAARGDSSSRQEFGRLYEPSVRAYLRARWRGSPRIQDVDDAVQEVFLECFRDGGVLSKADRERGSGFRALLYGVTRFVALRHERAGGKAYQRRGPDPADLEALPGGDASLSRVFDRSWARSLVREAVAEQGRRAGDGDDGAQRRVELLRLRFDDGLPIRDIAARWGEDPALVHRAYARARNEFLGCLREVVKFHLPHAAGQVDAECRRLVELLK